MIEVHEVGAERAAAVAKVADGAVVGSVLVDEIAEAITNNRDPVTKVLERVNALAKAVRSTKADGPATT